MLLRARFLCSAARLDQCPADAGAEVAFVGRSNAGKSSVINAVTGVSGLARSSRTPGRTRLLNFFTLEEAEAEAQRLVDLPGYGYARVSRAERGRWTRLMEGFLAGRRSLRGLVLVMDARHPLKPGDLELLQTAERLRLPTLALLNKADKPGGNELRRTERRVREELEGALCAVQLFSARKKTGAEEAAAQVRHWLFAEEEEGEGEEEREEEEEWERGGKKKGEEAQERQEEKKEEEGKPEAAPGAAQPEAG